MAKAVQIGHARIDENGNASGGVAGDQNGKEVCITDFYPHSKGWDVLRAKEEAVAEKIAKCMEDACANPNVGYDQYGRLSLYNNVKYLKFKCDINTLKVKVECDCSSLVRVCLAYAGIEVANFTTGNEKSVILATGKFDCLECDANGSNLKRGDILVTKTKGHTVVVLTNGAKYQKEEKPVTPTPQPTTKKTIYRVRKSWADAKSQIGAYEVLDNAKKMCDKNSGYYVFDESGNVVYPKATTPTTQTTTNVVTDSTKIDYAKKKDPSLAGTYEVSTDLYLRTGASTSKKAIVVIPKGTKVKNYGYYSVSNGVNWLLIQFTLNGVKYTGFSSGKYLIKK